MNKLLSITMLFVAGSIQSAVAPLRVLVGAAKTVTARAAQQRLISGSARLRNDPSKAELEIAQLKEQLKQLSEAHNQSLKHIQRLQENEVPFFVDAMKFGSGSVFKVSAGTLVCVAGFFGGMWVGSKVLDGVEELSKRS